jgi:hypothetical protein
MTAPLPLQTILTAVGSQLGGPSNRFPVSPISWIGLTANNSVVPATRSDRVVSFFQGAPQFPGIPAGVAARFDPMQWIGSILALVWLKAPLLRQDASAPPGRIVQSFVRSQFENFSRLSPGSKRSCRYSRCRSKPT